MNKNPTGSATKPKNHTHKSASSRPLERQIRSLTFPLKMTGPWPNSPMPASKIITATAASPDTDANGYGGAFERPFDNNETDFWNAVQDAVDAWIKQGGLQRLTDEEARRIADEIEF